MRISPGSWVPHGPAQTVAQDLTEVWTYLTIHRGLHSPRVCISSLLRQIFVRAAVQAGPLDRSLIHLPLSAPPLGNLDDRRPHRCMVHGRPLASVAVASEGQSRCRASSPHTKYTYKRLAPSCNPWSTLNSSAAPPCCRRAPGSTYDCRILAQGPDQITA